MFFFLLLFFVCFCFVFHDKDVKLLSASIISIAHHLRDLK